MVNKGMNSIAKRDRKIDVFFVSLTKLSAYFVLALVVGIILSLIIGSFDSIQKFGLGFFISGDWDPVSGNFGALAPIYGTLVSSMIALVIAVPVSFGIAFFLSELCPEKLRRPISTAIELLAGIPSIIYGMWGLFVFLPWFTENVQIHVVNLFEGVPILGYLFEGPPIGLSVFTAGFILAIMIIPFIAATIRDVLSIVPPMLKESAYGLGSTTYEVFKYIMLPFTKTGIVGAVMLGLGRALGETMAVTFVIGNAYNYSGNLFDIGNTISSTLTNEFAEASDKLHLSSLVELGLVLFLITFLVLILNKLLLRWLNRNLPS